MTAHIARLRPVKKSGMAVELMPLIDMLFMLLIFFMLSTNYLKPVVNMQLPEAEGAVADQPQDVITIVADSAGTFYVNQAVTPLSNVVGTAARLWKQNKQLAVVFSADTHLDYGKFVQVVTGLKKHGIAEIALEYENTP